MILLSVLTIVLILVLVAVLVVYLVRIAHTLEAIGGESRSYLRSSSLLSRARWGVRAIERQTGALGPGVARLEADLRSLGEGLAGIESGLRATVAALERQRGRRA